MTITVTTEVRLDAEAIVEGRTSTEHLYEFIYEIDKTVADVGFTERLIKGLIRSLKVDLDSDEMRNFINELKCEM